MTHLNPLPFFKKLSPHIREVAAARAYFTLREEILLKGSYGSIFSQKPQEGVNYYSIIGGGSPGYFVFHSPEQQRAFDRILRSTLEEEDLWLGKLRKVDTGIEKLDSVEAATIAAKWLMAKRSLEIKPKGKKIPPREISLATFCCLTGKKFQESLVLWNSSPAGDILSSLEEVHPEELFSFLASEEIWDVEAFPWLKKLPSNPNLSPLVRKIEVIEIILKELRRLAVLEPLPGNYWYQALELWTGLNRKNWLPLSKLFWERKYPP